MINLENLNSVTAWYSYEFTSSVEFYFSDEKSALFFFNKLDEIESSNNSPFVKYYPFPAGKQFLVKLDLGASANTGCRSNIIMDFVSKHFNLPGTIQVKYRKPNSHLFAPDEIISIPLTQSGMLAKPLNNFLAEIAVQQSFIKNTLSAFANSDVVVNISQKPNMNFCLEIVCISPAHLIQLKRKLLDIALEHNFDEMFHFESVSGLVGNQHKDRTIIVMNNNFDIHSFLTSITKATQQKADQIAITP